MSQKKVTCPTCIYKDGGGGEYMCELKDRCRVKGHDDILCDAKCCIPKSPYASGCTSSPPGPSPIPDPSPTPSPSPSPTPSPSPSPSPPSPSPSPDTIKCYDPKKNMCIPYGNDFPPDCSEGIKKCYDNVSHTDNIEAERHKCIHKCTWHSSPNPSPSPSPSPSPIHNPKSKKSIVLPIINITISTLLILFILLTIFF